MRQIWKYTLTEFEPMEIEMPAGAQIVHVDSQGNRPSLWVIINPDATREQRRFRIVATGERFDLNWIYRGSCQCPPYVWHVFEEITI